MFDALKYDIQALRVTGIDLLPIPSEAPSALSYSRAGKMMLFG